MATSKKTGLRYADLPAIDVARFADNPAASRAMEQIRQIVNTRFGLSGQPQDRAVTWGDLVENGIVAMRSVSGQTIAAPSGSGTFLPMAASGVDGIPPAPTGLTVTPGLATIIVEWAKPAFTFFGYAEVWRNTSDNLGTAVQVGQTTSWLYADPLSSSTTYFYWIRFISKGGKVGPFNAVAGTPGTTSLDPAYLIDVLSANDPNALLYNIPAPTVINGVSVPAGLYMRDIYVANGSISNVKIGNLAVDDAKIANLSAAKVTFGEMSGDRIAVNSLSADRLVVSTMAAAFAQITTAYIATGNISDLSVATGKIADLAVIEGKIANLAVTNAKIADLAVTNAKIADLSVTNAKIGDAQITAAKIGDAQITTAKIGQAQVDRLRIAGNAATVATSGNWGTIVMYADSSWRNAATLYMTLPEYADIMPLAFVVSPGSWSGGNANYPVYFRVLVNGNVAGTAITSDVVVGDGAGGSTSARLDLNALFGSVAGGVPGTNTIECQILSPDAGNYETFTLAMYIIARYR